MLTCLHIHQHPQPISLYQPCMNCYMNSISQFLHLSHMYESMHVCSQICMGGCIFACKYVIIYVDRHAWISGINKYVFIQRYACMSVYNYICMSVRVHAHTSMSLYIYMYACTYACMHACINVHIHKYMHVYIFASMQTCINGYVCMSIARHAQV